MQREYYLAYDETDQQEQIQLSPIYENSPNSLDEADQSEEAFDEGNLSWKYYYTTLVRILIVIMFPDHCSLRLYEGKGSS